MSENFDIVVVGAGIVGAATALALARDRWKVALVEGGAAPQLPAPDAPPTLRVSTLNPAAIQLLRNLEVWSALPESRLGWFDRMTVWENDRDLGLSFSAADAQMDQLGCVVENSLLAAALWQACEREVTVLAGNAIEQLNLTDRHATLALEDGTSLTADLVVAADGARSALRELAGIEVSRYNYEQQGLVASIDVEDHADTAWQRFLPTGPLAFLPLPGGAASIVWSVPEPQAKELLAADDLSFLRQLNDAAQGCVGEIVGINQRGAFPLTRLHANTYTGRRLALVGDAAHVVHPLAGQGANLGLLDAAALGDVMAELPGTTRNPADPTALRRYGRWRRSDNAIMVQALHQIAGVYARDTPGWRGLRLLGARALNQAGWLRGMLVQHASGFGGKVPRWVQPPTKDH
ncbi:MAG: UbiH/UbiF/VisC/COQ6 family ubiquinone biosynthesis hydroxylase [Lysobacterales bacterium]